MFNNLKNKIQKETGQDPLTIPAAAAVSRRNRMSLTSQNSLSIDELSKLEEKEAEINGLKSELLKARAQIESLLDEKRYLEHSVKSSQVQHELSHEESDKIQNAQFHEISNLRQQMKFREQESLDQLNKSKQDQELIQSLRTELARLKSIEPVYENIKDDFENLRRQMQIEKNQMITQISAKDEEIRHLTTRLEIVEESRALFTATDNDDENIKFLLHERKMLENRLEEAHIQLRDIKGSWTSKNINLENQLQRLSSQVAEETAEKRKLMEVRDGLVEKVKKLEFDMMKMRDDIKHRDNKIKLMTEEIDDLNSSLRDIRLENEEEIEFLRTKVVSNARKER